MGNHQNRRAGLFTQVEHQVDDLRLNRHIERSRWLIGDEQFGHTRQRHSDHHTLGLTARNFVRIGM